MQMKKFFFSLMFIFTFLEAHEKGMLPLFMQETNKAIPLPSIESLATTATIIGGITVGGITAFQKTNTLPLTEEAQTRFISLGIASTIFSSPVIWSTVGASAMAFMIYYLIGEEMSVIIETKKTLLKLTKQIELWQKELPLLKENQENITLKVKNALNVLDTITPLVIKLAKNSETTGAAQQVAAIKKELAELKETVQLLTTIQDAALGKKIEKKSHTIFGLGKKKSFLSFL